MPNVLMTQRCVRSCPYCFAEKHMSGAAPEDILGWEDLIYLADFLQASEERRFSLLGGEPTLHPEFATMAAYLIERGFELTVFTCGVMTERTLAETWELLGEVPDGKLTFICNLNDPAKTRTPLAEVEAVQRFLRLFGERTVPGFNIYRPDFDLGFLMGYINEFGLKRNIRIGVAHPIPGRKNRSIPLEAFGEVIDRLMSFTPLFERLRVKPGLDCGFPLCCFSDAQLGWLYRYTGGRSEFACGPVVDIGPDLSVWSCFPLANFHKRSVYEFDNLKQIVEHYAEIHRKIRIEAGGIFEACDNCVFREDHLCEGGCVAHLLARFQQEPPLRMREVYL